MKIGFLSLPLSGHINPMTALARRVQARGNDVVVFGLPDTETSARAAQLPFIPFCEEEFPKGYVPQAYSSVAKLRGVEVLRHLSREISPALISATLERLPAKIVKSGVEALVIDMVYSHVE